MRKYGYRTNKDIVSVYEKRSIIGQYSQKTTGSVSLDYIIQAKEAILEDELEIRMRKKILDSGISLD